MIALSRSSVFRPLIDSTLRAQSIELGETRFEVGYMGTAVALVEAGLGISCFAGTGSRPHQAAKGTVSPVNSAGRLAPDDPGDKGRTLIVARSQRVR